MNSWGYARKASAVLWALILVPFICLLPVHVAAENTLSYNDGTESYPYSVVQTGENYSFEFSRNPGKQEARLKAASHVLQSTYGDASVNPRHSRFFTKEGAKCFVFEANFYTYTACFLPNDYSPGNEERFWGFVTRVPNGWWLITRNLLPALLLLGGFLYFMLRKKPGVVRKGGGPTPAAAERPLVK